MLFVVNYYKLVITNAWNELFFNCLSISCSPTFKTQKLGPYPILETHCRVCIYNFWNVGYVNNDAISCNWILPVIRDSSAAMSQSIVHYCSSVLLILSSCVHVTGQEACGRSLFFGIFLILCHKIDRKMWIYRYLKESVTRFKFGVNVVFL